MTMLTAILAVPAGALAQAPRPDVGRNPSVVSGPPAPAAPASISRDAAGRATLRAHRLAEPIKVDGVLNEAAYEQAVPIGDFVQYEPANCAPATEKTELWIFFDDRNFYVAGRAYDSAPPERWVLNEMRRDNPNISNNESIGFSIDTFNDRRNAFLFELNAEGGFLDSQITNEGFPPNNNWNAVWEVRAGRFDGGWTFEFAIPFKSLRYEPGAQQVWGFNARRMVRWKNEESHIVPIPASVGDRRGLMQVSFSPRLVGVEVPPRGRNIELRPFATSTLATDVPTRVSNDADADVGLDVKYSVTQNLTADVTINTDFAQVEVDEQQVNLTRFSLLYPEKRTFFLEGAGTFDFARGAGNNVNGSDVPTLFFSRRIGLERNQAVPIVAGGRLTGKAGPYSIGLLNIQTDDYTPARAPSTNFGVVRLKRDVLRRSAIGVLYTGRSRTEEGGRNDTYGVDGAFTFYDNLNINAYFAHTHTAGHEGRDNSYMGQLNYAGDRYGLIVQRLVLEEGFNPDVGFVRRRDLRKWSGTARFSPRPARRGRVRKWLYEASGGYIEDNAGVVESRTATGTWGIDLQNGDTFRLSGIRSFEFLPRPFQIAPGVIVPVGGYWYDTLQASYALGIQRAFGGTATFEQGGFYDGEKTSVGLSAGRVELSSQLQLQPGVSLNWVTLPHGDFTAQQIQTRLIYTMTPRSFVSALVQYNSTNRSVGANIRLRWEYRPGSELFVVYNDQRDTQGSGFPALTNRAFIVKVTPLVRF
jgi:hypothetical protein